MVCRVEEKWRATQTSREGERENDTQEKNVYFTRISESRVTKKTFTYVKKIKGNKNNGGLEIYQESSGIKVCLEIRFLGMSEGYRKNQVTTSRGQINCPFICKRQ